MVNTFCMSVGVFPGYAMEDHVGGWGASAVDSRTAPGSQVVQKLCAKRTRQPHHGVEVAAAFLGRGPARSAQSVAPTASAAAADGPGVGAPGRTVAAQRSCGPSCASFLAGAALPCERTLARWVKRLGPVRRSRRRPRPAGVKRHPHLTAARRANAVWTVDFKGWFRTGDGTRVEPLTVRDLFSRYALAVRLLPNQRWQPVQAIFHALFQRHGLPTVIRVDNGGPFASTGPAGLSRLSVWWRRLGIRVEFTRPGCPQDNGAHEQFHRVLKRATCQPPARTPQGQQQRTSVWRVYFQNLELGQLHAAEAGAMRPLVYRHRQPVRKK